LLAASPFVGWGTAPETATGIATLGRVSFFGYPLPQMLGRLFFDILPFSTPIFSANILAALLFSISVCLVYYAAGKLSGNTAAGIAAAAGFAFIPGIHAYFSNVTPVSWTIFLSACLLASFSSAATGRPRGLHAAAFITGIGTPHSGYIAVFGLFACFGAALSLYRFHGKKTGWAAPLLLLFAGTAQLVFVSLRPPLYINFQSTLPPWLGRLSPVDNILARVLNNGHLHEILFNSLEAFEFLSGAFVLFFIAWLVGGIFFDGGKPLKWPAWILPVPALLFLFLSTAENRNGYVVILAISLCIVGACGGARIMKSIFRDTGRPFPQVLLVAILAALPAYYFSVSPEKPAPDHSRYYLTSLMKAMRRDAVLLVDPRPDDLHGIFYLQDMYNLRRDVTVVYPTHLLRRAYRRYVRAELSPEVAVPDEHQYENLAKQIASMAPDTPVGQTSAAIRRRIITGITEMVYEAIIVQNNASKYIYFNRLDHLMNSSLYALLNFMPAEYCFRIHRYVPGRTELEQFGYYRELGERMSAGDAISDPVVAEMTSVYFMNVGESYYKLELYDNSLPAFAACAVLDDDNISCRFFLGLIFKSYGQYSESEQNFREALRLLKAKSRESRYSSNDIFMLARIYRELGMREEADRYERMVQPGGINAPPPGFTRPE